jgi:uncharacterized membrane protein YccC
MNDKHMKLRQLLVQQSALGNHGMAVQLTWQDANDIDMEFARQAKRIAELERLLDESDKACSVLAASVIHRAEQMKALEQQLVVITEPDTLENDRHER